MKDNIDSEILRTLFEKGPMTCRAVHKAEKLNYRTAQRYLKVLRVDGLVNQTERAKGKRGRGIYNSLTEKGEHFLIDDAVGEIEKDLATLSHIDKKITPKQWKALERLHMQIGLVLRDRERFKSEKQQALESMFKVQCKSIREVGKIDIRVPKEA
jgi:predicted transcriptional regulator